MAKQTKRHLGDLLDILPYCLMGYYQVYGQGSVFLLIEVNLEEMFVRSTLGVQ